MLMSLRQVKYQRGQSLEDHYEHSGQILIGSKIDDSGHLIGQ